MPDTKPLLPALPCGLYESLMTEVLQEKIRSSGAYLTEETAPDPAGIPRLLRVYLGELIEKALQAAADDAANDDEAIGETAAERQVSLANRLIRMLSDSTPAVTDDALLAIPPKELLSLQKKADPAHPIAEKRAALPRPSTSVTYATLITDSDRGSANLLHELKAEIQTADRIDLLVAFVRFSGIGPMLDELTAFCQAGKKLRVITTCFTDCTELAAIRRLQEIGGDIRIELNPGLTRLHAKAYIFHRDTGFSTAYIGSSNLTRVAVNSGREWNVKITKTELGDTFRQIASNFERYWESGSFTPYRGTKEDDAAVEAALSDAGSLSKGKPLKLSMKFDIEPYEHQKQILEKLESERALGFRKNLVVAATGTGKTLIAAFDFRNYRRHFVSEKGREPHLLFIAHRREILEQSQFAFAAVLGKPEFGDLLVNGRKPEDESVLFASVQSLNRDLVARFPTDYYDYIVIDEFHHAVADSYQAILGHFRPDILLGLTATPERMDGKDILQYFDHGISAEIRLPQAIEDGLLCPFQYYVVYDPVSLENVTWRNGRYDSNALTELYTEGRAAGLRNNVILKALEKQVGDLNSMKCLAFCASVSHARAMAALFNEAGISSEVIDGTTPDGIRSSAASDLETGKLKALMTVDVFNEGVDIPCINTVLFLRPTESLTVFLQQLGRGLRKYGDQKDCLTVLDFVGQANARYNFEERFRALLSVTTGGTVKQIQTGFPGLPSGCVIEIEKRAQAVILENIRQFFGRGESRMQSLIRNFESDSGEALTLQNFLRFYRLTAKSFYIQAKRSFARCCADAGKREDFPLTDFELSANKALAKGWWADIDSPELIRQIRLLLSTPDLRMEVETESDRERRLTEMFAELLRSGQKDTADPVSRIEELRENPVIASELLDLLTISEHSRNAVPVICDPAPDGIPFETGCTYTRNQILIAMDRLCTWREGVKYFKNRKADVFLITINKSESDFTSSTRYEDYAINDREFHWQSQSQTRSTSETADRYFHHEERGSRVFLFVRERRTDPETKSAMSYTCLGEAVYVSHQGSAPINIVWRLKTPLSSHLLQICQASR